MEMAKEKITERSINMIGVEITTESGCNPLEGEYSMVIQNFVGSLDISSYGGVDDITLAKECIENDLEFKHLPEEGLTQVLLEESGEWEDVFWHKYYIIKRVTMVDLSL